LRLYYPKSEGEAGRGSSGALHRYPARPGRRPPASNAGPTSNTYHNQTSLGRISVDIRLLMRKKDELVKKKVKLLEQRQKILDKAVDEERGYELEEKPRVQALQNEIENLQARIEIFDEQIRETQDIENRRAGIIPGSQDNAAAQLMGRGSELAPGTSFASSLMRDRPRLVDVKTGKDVRCFLPSEDWTAGREYQLPDGIAPSELNLGRLVRGMLTGTWSGAEAERRTMAEATGSLGGILIPSVLADMIIQKARTSLRVLAAGALTLQMDTPELLLARIVGEPTASWVPEHGDATFSDAEFGFVKLVAHKCVCMSKCSEEQVMDSANLENLLTESLGFAIARSIDQKALTGSGVGEPLGISETEGIGLTDAAGAAVTIDQVLAGLFDLIAKDTEQRLISMIANADVSLAISLLKASTAGTYLESSAPTAWKNLAKFVTSQVTTSANKTDIFLGNFRDLYIGTRSNMMLEISRSAYDPATQESAFKKSQVFFRLTSRADSSIVKTSSFHHLKDVGV